MSSELIKLKARERNFLEQLLDGKKLENYSIPVPIKAELRKYQQVICQEPLHFLQGFHYQKPWHVLCPSNDSAKNYCPSLIHSTLFFFFMVLYLAKYSISRMYCHSCNLWVMSWVQLMMITVEMFFYRSLPSLFIKLL